MSLSLLLQSCAALPHLAVLSFSCSLPLPVCLCSSLLAVACSVCRVSSGQPGEIVSPLRWSVVLFLVSSRRAAGLHCHCLSATDRRAMTEGEREGTENEEERGEQQQRLEAGEEAQRHRRGPARPTVSGLWPDLRTHSAARATRTCADNRRHRQRKRERQGKGGRESGACIHSTSNCDGSVHWSRTGAENPAPSRRPLLSSHPLTHRHHVMICHSHSPVFLASRISRPFACRPHDQH